MSTREQAIAWWSMIAGKAREIIIAKLGVSMPLTGREIENIWAESGKPSCSMELNELKPEELVGRLVAYSSPYPNTLSVTWITEVTKTAFRTYNPNQLFRLNDGYSRGGDVWSRSSCELVTRRKAEEIITSAKAKARGKKLKNAIQDVIASATNEQMEEIAKILKLDV